jgi:hypothetical protein
MKRRINFVWSFAVFAAALCVSATHAGEKIDFGHDVLPIFTERCVRCHGAKKQEGGLRLDVRRRALLGGDSGHVIVAKSAAKSELIKRITSNDIAKRMPPGGDPLSAKQVAAIRAWIDAGVPWPDDLAGVEQLDHHWSFRPVKRTEPPAIKNKDRVRSPIDGFVLARLEKEGATLSSEAPRHTLVRRLYLDLLGLPPTPEEVNAFIEDKRADFYERRVDRLLASPHFGERWGRHWLDLARFAESDGYENDRLRPDAWRFRDWVVDAVNRDAPFDEFTRLQLAGDLLPMPSNDAYIAAGFHRNTLWNSAASADKEEFRTRAIQDRADTTSAVWMGLTLGCAKCHSHKYDPISQREYYQLYAFFNNTDNHEIPLPNKKEQILTLRATSRPTHVFQRGNFLQKGDAVTPDTPMFLPKLQTRNKNADRLDLANWLVDPRHPLTARVAVNHFWQHLFGFGLVRSPENFGANGEAPSHPELIDWLASEFVALKWSRKAMLRTIVLSSTYKQSSVFPAPQTKERGTDPDNRLLGRQNRFRVEAEIVRDLALASSGLLDRKLGGPSIVPPFPEGLLAQRFQAEALRMPTKEHHRRGVYIHVQRTLTYPMLAAFDVADGNQPCWRRDRSVTPMQALTLLNDPVFTEAAQALGARLRTQASDRDSRLKLGFQLCLGRSPNARELKVLYELVETQKKPGASDNEVWIGVARTLLNIEEFVTRE